MTNMQPPYITVAELIAELQKHPPGAVVFAADGFRYLKPTVVRIADTEYGIAPGMKKVAIMPVRERR